jgi:dipeptidyl-peptidase 4
MSFRIMARTALLGCLVSLSVILPVSWAQQSSPAAPASGLLTVDRIYSDPPLGGALTPGLAWTTDSRKLTYLESTHSGKTTNTELWVLDPASGARSLLISADKWRALLPVQPTSVTQATGLGRHAPPSYQCAPSGEALLLESPLTLAWFDLKSQSGHTLVSGSQHLADPKISPDGRYVSFVRDHNLWLVSIADGKERALTTGGTEEIRKGELDWVYPEELEIPSAYWWAPDSSSIAFLEMDERQVTQFSILDFESFTGEAEEQRYPVAGGKNPTVRVFVTSVSGGDPRLMDTGAETDIYLPRVDWLPDSKHLAIQRLNRPQTALDLLLLDPVTGKSTVIFTEKDAYWINVSHDLTFFHDSGRFLWSSERTGYRHLYLYDIAGHELKQLTKGDWEVTHIDAFNESKGLVYFSATEKSPLERHLYRVALDATGFTRLTREDGTHAVNFAPDASLFVDTYSNAMTPPRQDVFRADATRLATINENKDPELAQYHLSPVEFFTVTSHDGISLNCSMIKTPNFDPAHRYPVIVYTYGGPGAQVVLNAWGRDRLHVGLFLWFQMMAQKGYVIFSLDNRGSTGRGHLFEEPIHFRFGAQELSDQRDGAAWLALQPYVDPKRIGIMGWSYGGHMTLHAIFEAPEIYKAAFAGGPVTDWHYYDSIYTERYIGLLPANEESYQESSPIENASKLKGKLLIAHGTADDNVHFSNTLALVNDLLEAGKYAELLAFPGRGHAVPDLPANRVLWTRVMQFFLDNL